MTGPSALTPEKETVLVEYIGKGVPLSRAARAAGIHPDTLTDWLKVAEGNLDKWPANGYPVSPESKAELSRLSERIAGARASFVADAVANIAKTGHMVGKSGLPEWRAHAWLLNNLPDTRSEFHEQKTVEHTGQSTVLVESKAARQLSETQLASVLPPDLAGLLPPGTIDGEVVSLSETDALASGDGTEPPTAAGPDD